MLKHQIYQVRFSDKENSLLARIDTQDKGQWEDFEICEGQEIIGVYGVKD